MLLMCQSANENGVTPKSSVSYGKNGKNQSVQQVSQVILMPAQQNP